METTNALLTAIFAIFTQIGNWITTTLPTFFTLFYAEGSLTFLGVLAIVGLGMSIVFLLLNIIQNFLHLRG